MSLNRLSAVSLNIIRTNFNKHPLIANAIIYGTLFLGAESSQQVLSRKVLSDQPKDLDVASLARYAVVGTAVQGPLLHVWFKFLDNKFVGTSTKAVSKKLLVDQTIGGVAELLVFYLAMSVLEGKTDVFEEFRCKFVDSYKSSCVFWIPAQMLNFMLIPPAFRVVYFGVASIVWVNILCCIKRQEY